MKESEEEFDGLEWFREKGHHDVFKLKMDLIERNLSDKLVLDAGCGNGGKTNYFSKFTDKIHGIDLIEENIREAKNKYDGENIFFEIGNLEKLPFKDNIFDLIYSCWTIEHLRNPEKFLNESFRVLKQGGKLILWVPNVKSIEGFLNKMISVTFKVDLLSILKKESREKVSHQVCYYRANSVRKIDRITRGKFERVYLKRFDSPGLVRKYKFLTYLWYLKFKTSDNRMLNWTQPSFYVEYEKLS